MGTGYVRNDTPNNIADGNVINASDLDGEFDAVQAAFNASTGHSHDGTAGEGPQIAAGGLASNAVTTVKITDANVTLAKMAANSVDSDQYVDGSIDTAHIADNAVTAAKLDETGTYTVAGLNTTGNVSFGDNDKAIFGAGSDLQIYHNGANSYIDDTGTGNLYIRASDTVRLQSATGEQGVIVTTDGAVTLYHDNGAKLATTATGVDVTGVITTDGMTTSANINFGDSDRAIFGAGNDLQIYHDGSNSFIDDSGTGSSNIRGSQVNIGKYTGEDMITAVADGAVTLYHDNAAKLATTATGIDVTGVIEFGDSHTIGDDGNDNLAINSSAGENIILGPAGGVVNLLDGKKITFGSGQDLQIYHDGSNSYIDDAATGHLNIRASRINFQKYTGETMAEFIADGATSLRHNNAKKLATTATGVEVTGTVVADGVTVNKGSAGTLATFTDGVNSNFVVQTSSLLTTIGNGAGSGSLAFKANNSEKMRLTSAGNVGIGITAPSQKLVVAGNVEIRNDDVDGYIWFHDPNTRSWSVGSDRSTGRFAISSSQGVVSNLEFQVDASGNVIATGNVTAYSDERLKSDITTIDNALDKVTAMRGVTFTKDGEVGSGVIAQELEKIAPELVMDGEEYKSVAYGNLVGYLIEAVKELSAKVEALENGSTD